jgi:hypothetical protein
MLEHVTGRKKNNTLIYLCLHNYNTVVQVVFTFTLTCIPVDVYFRLIDKVHSLQLQKQYECRTELTHSK